MALQDIPKKKTRPLDPKFNVEIKPARKKAAAKQMIKSAAKPTSKKPAVKPKAPATKPPMKPKAKPTKKYRDATDIPGFMFGRGTE
jgi:hypothetical protein